MHSIVKSIFSIVLSLDGCMLAYAQVSETRLGNRIALGIRRNLYLETDMLLYIQAKNCLLNNAQIVPRAEILSLNGFEVFRKDMIIHEEATRMGSFEPTSEQIKGSLSQLQACRTGLEPILKDYGLSATSLSNTVAQIFRVESFRQSKIKQSEVLSVKERRGAFFSNHFEKWYTDLDKKYVTENYGSLSVYR